jgi:hypothetical protein
MAMPGASSAASSPLRLRLQPQPQPDGAIYGSRPSSDVEVGHIVPDSLASGRITVNETHRIDTPISAPRRRSLRNGTFRTVEDFEGLHVRPGWRPGAEPGYDPAKPDGGHASMPSLSAPCEITVVDLSQDDLAIQHLDNDTLLPFLKLAQPGWSICRWINVNGLSWDVIQTLGKHKKLHRLAIEDIMNTRNRTKAEW